MSELLSFTLVSQLVSQVVGLVVGSVLFIYLWQSGLYFDEHIEIWSMLRMLISQTNHKYDKEYGNATDSTNEVGAEVNAWEVRLNLVKPDICTVL